jgi:HSP20 family protein
VTAGYDAGVLTVRVAGAYVGTTARQIPVTTAAPAAVGTTPESTEAPAEA